MFLQSRILKERSTHPSRTKIPPAVWEAIKKRSEVPLRVSNDENENENENENRTYLLNRQRQNEFDDNKDVVATKDKNLNKSSLVLREGNADCLSSLSGKVFWNFDDFGVSEFSSSVNLYLFAAVPEDSTGGKLIYKKSVPIRILPDDLTELFRITMWQSWSSTLDHSTDEKSETGKNLRVILNSESDLSKSYEAVITASKYREIRRDQNWRVDFSAFPDKVIQLFDVVISQFVKVNFIDSSSSEVMNEQRSNKTRKSISRSQKSGGLNCFFRADPSAGNGVLSVVEETEIRDNTHLLLSFNLHNHDLIKNNLSVLLSASLLYGHLVEHKLSDEILCRSTLERQLHDREAEHERKLKSSTAALSETHSEVIKELETRLKNKEKSLEENQRSSSCRIKELEQKLSDLNFEVECSKRNESRLQSLADRTQNAENENIELKNQNRKFQTEIEILNSKVDQMRIESEKYSEELKNNAEKLNTMDELKSKLTDSVKEIHKGNDIIERLNSQLKLYRNKWRGEKSASESQSKETEDLRRMVDTLTEEKNEISKKIELIENKFREIKTENETINQKNQTLQSTVENQADVIDLLNRQLTDKEISKILNVTNECLPKSVPNFENAVATLAQGSSNKVRDTNAASRSCSPAAATILRTLNLPVSVAHGNEHGRMQPFTSALHQTAGMGGGGYFTAGYPPSNEIMSQTYMTRDRHSRSRSCERQDQPVFIPQQRSSATSSVPLVPTRSEWKQVQSTDTARGRMPLQKGSKKDEHIKNNIHDSDSNETGIMNIDSDMLFPHHKLKSSNYYDPSSEAMSASSVLATRGSASSSAVFLSAEPFKTGTDLPSFHGSSSVATGSFGWSRSGPDDCVLDSGRTHCDNSWEVHRSGSPSAKKKVQKMSPTDSGNLSNRIGTNRSDGTDGGLTYSFIERSRRDSTSDKIAIDSQRDTEGDRQKIRKSSSDTSRSCQSTNNHQQGARTNRTVKGNRLFRR